MRNYDDARIYVQTFLYKSSSRSLVLLPKAGAMLDFGLYVVVEEVPKEEVEPQGLSDAGTSFHSLLHPRTREDA